VPTVLPILARGDVNVGSVIVWSLALLALVIGGFFGVTLFRKWLAQDEGPPKMGFTLGDMREMLRAGQITQEEYDRAKGQMIAATQRAADRAATQAAEEAKNRGEGAPRVTDIEELRRRAKRNLGGDVEPPNPPQRPNV
jgi:hypothetical protein